MLVAAAAVVVVVIRRGDDDDVVESPLLACERVEPLSARSTTSLLAALRPLALRCSNSVDGKLNNNELLLGVIGGDDATAAGVANAAVAAATFNVGIIGNGCGV